MKSLSQALFPYFDTSIYASFALNGTLTTCCEGLVEEAYPVPITLCTINKSAVSEAEVRLKYDENMKKI